MSIFFTLLLQFLLFYFGSGEKGTKVEDGTELASPAVKIGSFMQLYLVWTRHGPDVYLICTGKEEEE